MLSRRRPQHPDKHLERLLRDAENQPTPWRVTHRSGYYTMWCPCPGKHRRTVHLTPSDPNYEKNLRGWLRRSTCWEERP